MTIPTPGELIQRSADGDTAAFALLVREFYPKAHGLSVRLLGSPSDADDVAQEAFIRVWTHLSSFDPTTRFGTWLYTIVTNLCMDHLRRRARRFRFGLRRSDEENLPDPADPLTPELVTVGNDLAALVNRIAAELPATQRLVFTLRDLEDLSIDEVTAITGLSSESVRTNLHYARRRIRNRLERDYEVKGAVS